MKHIILVLLALCAMAHSKILSSNLTTTSPFAWILDLPGVPLEKLKETRLHPAINVFAEDLVLPKSFDARQQWPQCSSLNEIRTQGCCGSCAYVSGASAMTDRWCIHSKGKKQFTFGAFDLLSCCYECGGGCTGGGIPGPIWSYWVKQGVSSGGPYGSNQGCHPYPMPPSCPKPSEGDYPDEPNCSTRCNAGYNVTEDLRDRRFGRVAYSIPADERKIMEDIFVNGPVQAVFQWYEDIVNYSGGVYRHQSGRLKGGHAVKLIGWGVEDGTKYWLVANSWGRVWGDDGFFKMVRGENHCGIEENVHAGLPSFVEY
ncbi:AAEL007590-PA [Aedes aegypti]|uniref:AAEL007590-PA n=1 Tax=Aedes aegypti TaxID=7159 RepID=Q171L8_AEDAE|nr:AAEL007590-PA [Aedes aegypti]